jgi:thioredoxin-related protein
MKKIISISLIIIAAVMYMLPANAQTQQAPAAPPANGPKIKWYDFEDAVALSQKKPKKIFIDMYTDWCGWCKKMDASTFTNPVIVEYMNQHFYAVKFNAERKDTVSFQGKSYYNSNPEGSRSSHQLAIQLLAGRMSYPTYIFMDETQGTITTVPGYRKAPEFEAILNYIGSDAYKTQKWEEFTAGFKTTAVE